MNGQKELIHQKDWDALIILDSCRYDAFSDTYEEHLSPGVLQKVRSPVDTRNNYATSDWCRKVFDRQFPHTAYVSASPRINPYMEVDGFDGREHFDEIIDVWGEEWDEDVGTVPPERVTDAAEKEINNNRFDRTIVHYVQPHWPFLGLDVPAPKKPDPKTRETLRFKLRTAIGPHIRYTLGPQRTRSLGRLLGLPPLNYMDSVLREVGAEKLREGYYNNLERVLPEVAKLTEELDGKIVITADHGEMLGENRYYGHSYVPDHPKVVNVPWLEIDA